MTYKEKLMKEHPARVDETGWCTGCPFMYGYEPEHGDSLCQKMTCNDCWDREIPETEEVDYGATKRFEEYLKTAQPLPIIEGKTNNPVEKAYMILSKAFFKRGTACASELSIAIGEALGYLGEALE